MLLVGLLLGAAFLAVFSLGFHFMLPTVIAGAPAGRAAGVGLSEFVNFIMMAGLYAVNFLSIAMGALLAADTLSGEVGSGTIQAIAVKPIRRASIVMGKWLAFAILLALYQVLLAWGVIFSVWAQAGYLPPNPVPGLALMYMEAILIMTLTMASSSRLSGLATGGVVFGLFGIAFLGGWVEQLGSFAGNATAVQVGIVSSLIIPSEALWKRAAYEMTSPLVRLIGFSPFSSSSVPSDLMVVYAGVYLILSLMVALWSFERRDL
jgi:ABC-type transport system involved in multi-copper enzyme maturation permease subunit